MGEVVAPKYIGWVAEELGKRLKDKVAAQVQPKADRIIVVVTAESRAAWRMPGG